MRAYVSYFFFFQAEDGIRDDLVTGVQTCALPISISTARRTPGSPVSGGPTRSTSWSAVTAVCATLGSTTLPAARNWSASTLMAKHWCQPVWETRRHVVSQQPQTTTWCSATMLLWKVPPDTWN